MPTPIICFDLDGTLLDGEDRIHPRDREILTAKQDALLMPCTGRPYDSVVGMFHANGLFTGELIPFPVITQNGSAVHLPGGEIAAYHTFPTEVQERLLSVFEGYPEACFMLMERDGVRLLNPNDFGVYWMERFLTKWRPCNGDCRGAVYGKATCLTDEREIMQSLASRLQGAPLEFGVSLSSVFDINPQGVSKRTGVICLAERLGLAGSPVYAAGDGENDLDLFTLARVSFAPLTAARHVQEQADVRVDVTRGGLLTVMLEEAGCL